MEQSAQPVRVVVPADQAGGRLDKVVADATGLGRAAARRLVEQEAVLVDGRPGRPSERVRAGQAIEIEVLVPDETVQPEEVVFAVRYEDEYLAVVDKPPGVVVHPGAGHRAGTLVAGLLHRWPHIEGVGESPRWGIVHRLDRDTSGLLIVALDEGAHQSLQKAMRRREVERRYLALAHGRFELPTGTIDAPIGHDAARPTRRAVVAGGRPARTHYEVLRAWSRPPLALLDVRLETGRTHQIRVHLASIDHPLVGDRAYGRPGPPGVDPGRVWLHAARLAFRHPVTGAAVTVQSPLPEDLQSTLDHLDDG